MFRINSERLQASNKAILLLTDTCLILLSVSLAAVIPLLSEGSWTQILRRDTLSKFVFLFMVFAIGLQYSRLYSFSLTTRRRELMVRSLRGMGVAYVLLAAVYAWRPHFSLGGKATALAVTMILVSVVGWRLAIGKTSAFRNRIEKVIVLGRGELGREIANTVSAADDLDMEIVGFVDDGTLNLRTSNLDVIGRASDLESIVRREKIDRVVVSVTERRGRMPLDQLLRLKMAGVRVEDAHSLYERLTGRIRLEHLTPSWLFMSSGFRNRGLRLRIKYALDFLVSLLLLTAFAPVMIVVAVAIWIESGRPILFVQNRVGRNGAHFRMFKFRSMSSRTEAAEARWATDDDHRITRVGRFIRKYRFDELPQIFNVLRGDMSLVGPRPEQPFFCQMLGRQVQYFTERHSVRPGITGWAQVNYGYGATVDESKMKLEYDLFYLKHMSLLLDLMILFSSVSVVLSGKGAK